MRVEASEQQERIRAVAERLVQVAPQGWARLVGNWEATVVDGEVSLNWITLGVVDLGDRWGAGQFGYDAVLYDLVVELNEAVAATGERWSVLDLEVDRDGDFRTQFGYGPARRTLGIPDEESLGRFESYLDSWVAEHGPVPGGGAAPPEGGVPQAATAPPLFHPLAVDDQAVADLVAEYTHAQPGWVRVVVWMEQLGEPGQPRAYATVHRVIVHDASGLRAEYVRSRDREDRDAFSRVESSLEGVRWHELRIVADRDGGRDVVVRTEPVRAPDGSVVDPPWELVHDHLELNRPELEALVERLRASGDLPGAGARGSRRGLFALRRRDRGPGDQRRGR